MQFYMPYLVKDCTSLLVETMTSWSQGTGVFCDVSEMAKELDSNRWSDHGSSPLRLRVAAIFCSFLSFFRILLDKQGIEMNGLSFSEICCLFCCPPCPGRIAAKLAFLPPDPTYSFQDLGDGSFGLHLTEKAEWQYGQKELDCIEVFTTKTSKGNQIGCMYVRCAPNARFTLLFSHGNAVDLGQMSSFYVGLGTRINCNIFSYDYSGYGVSQGRPSETNLYADIDAAWQALRTRYGISPENIIVYGQSIGTVPTVDLASRFECAGIILHSPLTSGMRVAFPDTKRTWCFDAFPR